MSVLHGRVHGVEESRVVKRQTKVYIKLTKLYTSGTYTTLTMLTMIGRYGWLDETKVVSGYKQLSQQILVKKNDNRQNSWLRKVYLSVG